MNKRVREIDCLKGIVIILVIIGHVGAPNIIESYLYTFHMPIFFVISGFLYKTKENKIYFIKRKLFSLIWPYITFGCIEVLFLTCIKIFAKTMSINMFIEMLCSFVYGNKIFDTNYIGALWFLPGLFSVELLAVFFINDNAIISTIKVIGITVFGFIWIKYVDIRLPFAMEIAMSSLLFFNCGYLVKKNLQILKYKLVNYCLLALGGGTAILNLSMFCNNTHVDILKHEFGCPILFLVSAMLICVSLLGISFDYNWKGYEIEYIGKNSLIIMSVHILIILGIKCILKIYKYELYWYIMFGIVFIVSVLSVIVINKWLPFLCQYPSKM